MDEAQTSGTSVEVTTAPVTPEEARDNGRDTKGHEQDQPQVVAVLPPDNFVLGEVRDISDTRLAARLEDHPA
jgi:hypothetical protein